MGSRKIGRKASRSTWGNIIIVTLLVLIAVFMALPLVYAIVTAFKPIDELFMFPPRFFVMRPTTRNFKDLFALMAGSFVPFSRYLFNSLQISIVGTVGHVIIASMAAYPMSKHKFPGRNIIFTSIILSLMFQGNTLAIPQYIILSKLGLIDSQLSVISLSVASALGLFLMKQFMENVPDALLESARIDGASEFRTFWQIAMPSVKPATLTLIILQVQGLWYNTGSSFLYSEQLKTLPVALGQILSGGIAFGGMGAAAMLIIISVPIIVFVVNQANVVRTFTSSGIKE
jgi:ABC-type glycerol-3-phosphate transport system permease component